MKMKKLSLLLFGASFVTCACAFEVAWNDKPLRVSPARVSAHPINQVWTGYQRPVEQTILSSFVSLDMDAAGVLTVVPDASECAGDPIVLPMSYAPALHWDGGVLRVKIDRPRQFTITFGAMGKTLHVFANPPFVAPSGPNVRCFGPGEHHVGVVMPKSGETIVIEEGAVVHGSIFIAHAHDVRICGRGIVDGSSLDRNDRACAVFKAAAAAGFETNTFYGALMAVTDFTCAWSTNVTVEGVTFRDPPRWTVIVRAQSKNVTLDNVKIVGCWRYNSDGINVCASEDVTIRNSFVRSFDDCIVARGALIDGDTGPTRNLLVENCILWCDWGKNLEVWAGSRPCLIENIAYRNIAAVQTSHMVADVTTWYASSDTRIRNVTMEDVEVDYPFPVSASHYQTSREDAAYRGGPRTNQQLIVVDVARYGRNCGNQKCEPVEDLSGFRVRYENLAFRNFRVYGKPPSLDVTIDAQALPHTIDGVEISNMPKGVAVSCRGNVKNVRNPLGRGEARVPFIYCSDIFHPAMDPDDHFDLAALFALEEFDVKALVLDGHIDRKGQDQFNGGGRIPLAQMCKITGRRVPAAVGLNVKLANPLDTLPNGDARFLAGVVLMKRVLEEADQPVAIKISTGTDLAVLYNREPELCRRKIRAVYFNAGHGVGGVTDEYNVLLDPVAFTRIFETGLPIYWNPCFGEKRAVGDGHCNFFIMPDQRVVLEKAPLALSRFFSYALLNKTRDPLAWLEDGSAAEVPAKVRWMWTPPVLAHAAGRRVYRLSSRDCAWCQPGHAPRGAVPQTFYRYDPARVTVDPARRSQGVLRVEYGATNANVWVFRQLPGYDSAMTQCLRNLYGDLHGAPTEAKAKGCDRKL